MKKCFLICVILLSLLEAIACSSSVIQGGSGYWVPADPPKCHYEIEAEVSPNEGFIVGTETITLENNFDRAMEVVALDWRINARYSIDCAVNGEILALLNKEEKNSGESPLFYRLPEALEPGQKIRIDIGFKETFDFEEDRTTLGRTSWYPRVWWDGLPVHDSFSVKLDIPEGWALAISGRMNANNDRYEIDGARTFGIHLAKDQMTETREVDGIQVTTLFTEKGAKAASVCMDTAVDAIAYYKDWLGFYLHLV